MLVLGQDTNHTFCDRRDYFAIIDDLKNNPNLTEGSISV